MKQERVILSFIMVLIGLLVAGTAFYLYQSGTKKTIANVQVSVTPTPTPEIKNPVILTISTPSDETVVSNKNLTISGKTNPQATIVLLTDSDQQVFQPNANGDFTTTTILDNNQNLITIISILPNGDSRELKETVTYSTSNF